MVPCEPARSDAPRTAPAPPRELPGLAARRRQREALQDADHTGRGRAFLHVRADFCPTCGTFAGIMRRVLRLLPADGGRGPASRGLSHHAVRPHASGRGGKVPGPLHQLRRGPGLTRGHRCRDAACKHTRRRAPLRKAARAWKTAASRISTALSQSVAAWPVIEIWVWPQPTLRSSQPDAQRQVPGIMRNVHLRGRVRHQKPARPIPPLLIACRLRSRLRQRNYLRSCRGVSWTRCLESASGWKRALQRRVTPRTCSVHARPPRPASPTTASICTTTCGSTATEGPKASGAGFRDQPVSPMRARKHWRGCLKTRIPARACPCRRNPSRRTASTRPTPARLCWACLMKFRTCRSRFHGPRRSLSQLPRL